MRFQCSLVPAWLAIGSFCALLVSGATARAFSEPLSYFDDAANGGGGGRWFTGSPAEGYGCSVCHTSDPGQQLYPFYVEGLPAGGYAPGATYPVRISWPEFAAKADQDRQMAGAPGVGSPALGVIAELVAEDGTSSGTLDIDTSTLTPGEQCEIPAGMPGMALYSVRPATTLADSTKKVTHCDANQLGTRCLLAVRSCGSREVNFRWTAPPQWQGPIWFAAGFVATEALSGTPASDSVQEIAHPLMPATSGAAHYEARLYDGCSASRPGALRTGGAAPFALAFALVLRRRRKRAPRAGWKIFSMPDCADV